MGTTEKELLGSSALLFSANTARQAKRASLRWHSPQLCNPCGVLAAISRASFDALQMFSCNKLHILQKLADIKTLKILQNRPM